ncbi:hypothetical protein CFELI_07735 [Corynebacterium felinum]|uniref:LemA family protein n=1 Tax=Corynebacterium felinum TaxID=131318 RepID=A0ABU2BB28_9CORY|nr:hypothetical protein [Corynebacterium felinum]WJY95161.1 hypothetical protein CFELI_07735 [Corynebacterium felinum]
MTLTTMVAVVTAVVVTVLVFWASSTANRLHRLHVRTEAALNALQAALDRRCAVLAALYPQHWLLAHEAESVSLDYQSLELRAEKERAVASAIAQLGQELPPAIVDAEARVQLAHRFYNDAVTDTRHLRVQPVVRVLRLGGTARLPEYFTLAV